MNRHHCTDCHRSIPVGEAVLRSAGDFTAVTAWHRDCYQVRELAASMRPVAAI